MLRLRIDADPAPALLRLALDQFDDRLERRDLELAVELGGPTRAGAGLARAELLDLGEREVLCSEARRRNTVERPGRLTRSELGVLADVGRGVGRARVRVTQHRL